MARFIPSEHVEALEYDFTEYGGGAGTIIEPSTKKVNDFFTNMKTMIKEVQASIKQANGGKSVDLEDLENIEELDDDKLTSAMGAMDEVEVKTSDYQRRTMQNIAVLCGGSWVDPEAEGGEWTVEGGSPSIADLETLPFRVLQAFSQWLVKEIQPKKTAPGTRR